MDNNQLIKSLIPYLKDDKEEKRLKRIDNLVYRQVDTVNDMMESTYPFAELYRTKLFNRAKFTYKETSPHHSTKATCKISTNPFTGTITYKVKVKIKR